MEHIDYILDLLDKIPASTWGVIIGASISFIGILLTNRAHESRLRAQFEHDRNLKTQDREFSLKRDIFLSASEAISIGFSTLNSLANLEKSEDDIFGSYQKSQPAIAKLYVIANAKTYERVSNFSSDFNSTCMRLSAKRIHLATIKGQMKILDDLVASFGKKRDEMVELMAQYNLAGKTDKREWSVIQGGFDFEQKRINEHLEKRADIFKHLREGQLNLIQECFQQSMRLNEVASPVMAAVRDELGFPLDENLLSRLSREMLIKQQEALANFLEEVRKIGNELEE